MSDSSLGPHPEYQALTEENALLREELANLLTEESDLVSVVKPNLLALYQQKIGAWELRALQVQVAAARARRKLEMAQAPSIKAEFPISRKSRAISNSNSSPGCKSCGKQQSK